MPSTGTVEALWVGPYEADLADGTRVVPGETKVHVSEHEAHASDYWQVVESKPRTVSVISSGGDS